MSFAASGGVHEAVDAIKAGMAGAHVVQMVSALLKHGPAHLRVVVSDLEARLVEHEYESWQQLRASMNLHRCPNPSMYERGNYAHLLQTWHGTDAPNTAHSAAGERALGSGRSGPRVVGPPSRD